MAKHLVKFINTPVPYIKDGREVTPFHDLPFGNVTLPDGIHQNFRQKGVRVYKFRPVVDAKGVAMHDGAHVCVVDDVEHLKMMMAAEGAYEIVDPQMPVKPEKPEKPAAAPKKPDAPDMSRVSPATREKVEAEYAAAMDLYAKELEANNLAQETYKRELAEYDAAMKAFEAATSEYQEALEEIEAAVEAGSEITAERKAKAEKLQKHYDRQAELRRKRSKELKEKRTPGASFEATEGIETLQVED